MVLYGHYESGVLGARKKFKQCAAINHQDGHEVAFPNTLRHQGMRHQIDQVVEIAIVAAQVAVFEKEAFRPHPCPLAASFSDVHEQSSVSGGIRFMIMAAKVPPEDIPLRRPQQIVATSSAFKT
jgi:hypothetical protein